MTPAAPVGRSAFLLGFAGLLPQVAAVALIVVGRGYPTDLAWIPFTLGFGLAVLYPAAILSFLGGIWWGFAMRRSAGQARLVALAVMPSLAGVACAAATAILYNSPAAGLPLIALGVSIVATLIVDRRLVVRGEAPVNWLRLRVPLSLGLGLLTISAGIVAGGI